MSCSCTWKDYLAEVVLDSTEEATVATLEGHIATLQTKLAAAGDCEFPMKTSLKNLHFETRSDYVNAITRAIKFFRDEIDAIEGLVYIRVQRPAFDSECCYGVN